MQDSHFFPCDSFQWLPNVSEFKARWLGPAFLSSGSHTIFFLPYLCCFSNQLDFPPCLSSVLWLLPQKADYSSIERAVLCLDNDIRGRLKWVSVYLLWMAGFVRACLLSKCPCSGTWEPFGGRQLPPSLYTCGISPHPFPTRALVVTLGSFPGRRHLVNLQWMAHHTSLLGLSCENLACYITTDYNHRPKNTWARSCAVWQSGV